MRTSLDALRAHGGVWYSTDASVTCQNARGIGVLVCLACLSVRAQDNLSTPTEPSPVAVNVLSYCCEPEHLPDALQLLQEQAPLDSVINLRIEQSNSQNPDRALIYESLAELVELFERDSDCVNYLGGSVRAEEVIRKIVVLDMVAYGETDHPDLAAFNGQGGTTGLPKGIAILIQRPGPFFSGRWTVAGLDGGTAQARWQILLHELGHAAGTIEPDADNEDAMDRNNDRITEGCSATFSAAGP